MPYSNNKCAAQPSHQCSLISTFVVRCLDSIIIPVLVMPPTLKKPTLKKLVGHIAFGLFMCAFITLIYASCNFGTVHARVLKFHISIPHGKIADPYFFLVRVMPLFGVMPL